MKEKNKNCVIRFGSSFLYQLSQWQKQGRECYDITFKQVVIMLAEESSNAEAATR